MLQGLEKMPIYVYRCNFCGEQDIMQRLSDAPLTECPKCKSTEFKKQVTSAGFSLKGTGWYKTDFK